MLNMTEVLKISDNIPTVAAAIPNDRKQLFCQAGAQSYLRFTSFLFLGRIMKKTLL